MEKMVYGIPVKCPEYSGRTYAILVSDDKKIIHLKCRNCFHVFPCENNPKESEIEVSECMCDQCETREVCLCAACANTELCNCEFCIEPEMEKIPLTEGQAKRLWNYVDKTTSRADFIDTLKKIGHIEKTLLDEVRETVELTDKTTYISCKEIKELLSKVIQELESHEK